MSCGFSWSALKMVPTTWTSLRNPFGKEGPQRPVDDRQIRMAWSESFPSRRKKAPGILPRGVRALSMSTVSGKKSMPSRACVRPRQWRAASCHRCEPARLHRRVGRGDPLQSHGLIGARDWATYANGVSHGIAPYAVSNTPPGSQWATYRARDCSPLASEASDMLNVDGVDAICPASDECRVDRSKRDSARHCRAAHNRADGDVDQ